MGSRSGSGPAKTKQRRRADPSVAQTLASQETEAERRQEEEDAQAAQESYESFMDDAIRSGLENGLSPEAATEAAKKQRMKDTFAKIRNRMGKLPI
jgi:hypothetical protein